MAKVVTNSKKSALNGSERALTDSQRSEIEKLAYQFYLERGGDHGDDQTDWLRAEAIIRSRRN